MVLFGGLHTEVNEGLTEMNAARLGASPPLQREPRATGADAQLQRACAEAPTDARPTTKPPTTFADVFERMQTRLASAANLPDRIPPSKRIPVVTLSTGLVSGAVVGGLAGGPIGLAIGAVAGLTVGAATAGVMKIKGLGGRPGTEEGERASVPRRVFENVSARVKHPERDVHLEPDLASPLLTPDVQTHIDNVTGVARSHGNDVRLLTNGVQAYDARTRLMSAAKHSICLQTYIFRDDETGRRTAELLREKAREGVDVRVIVDGIGSHDTPKSLFDEMRADGVKVINFNPLSSLERLNHRWHQKMLIVDDGAAVMGGMNVGSEYALYGTGHVDLSNGASASSATWVRDTDIVATGPVVVDAMKTFARNWQLADADDAVKVPAAHAAPPVPIDDLAIGFIHKMRAHTEPTRNVDTRLLVHRPYEDRDTRIEDWYVAMLDNAQTTAYISNAYFVPTDAVTAALERAAKRGVDVRVLTNSAETNDSTLPLAQWAGRASYEQLLEAGVRIYETPDANRVLQHLHKKTAVFDGVSSTVGSYNLDPRSANLNSENTLVIEGADFGRQMNRMFANDLRKSREIDLETLRNGTLYDRLQQWFFGEVMRDHI
ncbi:MAG: phosphatidylserine/phosphatidylglycerophosphate/cardiolipin synthase family protein [Proteobacteria bacterium]|nr:phosphatidylserine/phosphatidylglycerophosphate/cardiolipin synthase family protein [Pseudomonadota bacterium]